MQFPISDQYQLWPYLALFSHSTTMTHRRTHRRTDEQQMHHQFAYGGQSSIPHCVVEMLRQTKNSYRCLVHEVIYNCKLGTAS